MSFFGQPVASHLTVCRNKVCFHRFLEMSSDEKRKNRLSTGSLDSASPSRTQVIHTSPHLITVPKNLEENRRLKEGHVEDNNEDIAYFNIPVWIPSVVFAVSSTLFTVGAVVASLYTDYIPTAHQLKDGFIAFYGSSRFACNQSVPFPSDALPSMLNLLELNVAGNVLFRFAVCVPMVVRIFHAYTLKSMLRAENPNANTVYRLSSDLLPIVTAVEVLSMSLFSIITLHNDFPDVHCMCKVVFTVCATVNMLLTTGLTFGYNNNSQERPDSVSLLLKLMAAVVFVYVSPQYFLRQHNHIADRICHSYLPRQFALLEYAMILAYFIFHITMIIDLRHIRFMCYPRTCSGECEPLDPANFAPEGKYAHCRSFEHRQRETKHI